jgi:hypothetical protein
MINRVTLRGISWIQLNLRTTSTKNESSFREQNVSRDNGADIRTWSIRLCHRREGVPVALYRSDRSRIVLGATKKCDPSYGI